MEQLHNITLINADCMEVMKTLSDNTFDIAIVDPPYGIGQGGEKNISRGNLCAAKNYITFNDDLPPPLTYFQELRRVSKNQIIWGANHFISRIPYDSSCWIVWDKDNGSNDFADCELAWTSFNKAVRKFKFRWQGMLQENMKNKEIRIHPTQKPVDLYAWIINNFCNHGDTILDTHLGSGSICIAAHALGYKLTGIELNEKYFIAAKRRIEYYQAQGKLF